MRVLTVRAHLAFEPGAERRYRLVEGSRSFLFEFGPSDARVLAGAVAHLVDGELGPGDAGTADLSFWARPVWPHLVGSAPFVIMYPRRVGSGRIVSVLGERDLL
jgi:hypothetical protein